MRFPVFRALTFAAIGAVVAVPARGAVLTLQALKDNTLYESPSGTLSNGAGQFFYAGRTNQGANSLRRGVIAFDLAPLPPGSVVTAVTLSLHVSRSNSGASPFSLHPLLANWGEGTSNSANGGAGRGGGDGVSPTTNDATWLDRFFNTPGTRWATAGGDFRLTPSATRSVGGAGTYTFGPAPQMTADVQSWVNAPLGNFGWAVTADNEALKPSAKQFDSRESASAAFRPVLTVTYTPAPEPASAAALTLTFGGLLLRSSRRPRPRSVPGLSPATA
jgi:hypothetical protein